MRNELIEAIKAKDLDRARQVAKQNPMLARERDENGLLMATQAFYYGLEDLARELLPPDDQLSIFEATTFGRRHRVNELMSHDPTLVDAWSPDGFTPLHLALFSGDEATVRCLLDYGPDLEAPARGATATKVRPLHTAAFVRNPGLAELLLDAGADVNSREAGGFTALHAAAENKDTAMARMLLQHGADPSARDDKGRTAAEVADEMGATETAQLLRAGGS
jgi:ankyrin repeat protein